MKKFRVVRQLTKEERAGADDKVQPGNIVYLFKGCTYGCISHNGMAVSHKPDDGPFFEMPCDTLEEIK